MAPAPERGVCILRPLLRWSARALAGLLLALMLLLAGLWVWTGSDTSLAVALQRVQSVLPAGQTLQTRDVSGSLRHGGHIGWLRWQQGELSVELNQITLAWEPGALLQRRLHLSQLHIERMVIQDQRAPTPAAPTPPPTDLGLPFQVDADVQIDAVEITGLSTQRLDKLSAHYQFDSYLHRIDKGQGQFLSNNYSFSAQLQASGPMALEVQAHGAVDAAVPGSAQPLRLDAQASLRGALAGPQAELVLQADLKPQAPPATSPPARAVVAKGTQPSAMQASLSAHIAPWQAQKILRAQGQWQALNVASLWPQAPQTLLTGQASVSPQGDNWQADLVLDNAQSGPWNQQRLPVQQVQAKVLYTGGHWLLQSLKAQAAGGQIQANGQFGTAPVAGAAPGSPSALWQGQARVQGLNPAAIDTRLATDTLSGTANVHQSADTHFSFDVDVQSSQKRAASVAAVQTDLLAGLHLQSLKAQGTWAAPLLVITELQLDAQQAKLQGQLQVNTASLATQGKLNLSLSGLQAVADGRASASDGLGTLSIQVQDATQASHWLSWLPAVKQQLAGGQLRGKADLSAHWRGGWQRAMQGLQLDASLNAPQLDWLPAAPAPSTPLALRDTQLSLSGLISSLQVSSQGRISKGAQQAQWQTQATAGRATDGSWHASVEQAQLSVRGPNSAIPWSVRLGAPNAPAGAASAATPAAVSLRWLPGASVSTLTVSAGSARLTGPGASAASFQWQPMQWAQPVKPGQTSQRPAQWRSQGRIDGVPLAWLDAFTQKPMAELGISSDVLLAGSWDAAQSDTLHVRATLERSAGDVRIQADAGRSAALPAGMQEAWMQVNLDDDQVSGTLRWNSQRAGRALAAFGTRIKTDSGGWTWPGDAPLGGSLQLQLPPVDAWSVLAPPGWRLHGTVDSHIDLSGTHAKPLWEGTLRARDLAVRSLVDGIDFGQGTLDARLHGQQLDIQTFTLRGAGTPQDAAAGGLVNITGSVLWLPESGQTDLRQRVQMALQAKLTALRLSARPDRRLVASGQLQADLKDARLTVRGSLTADQALITLPDDSTPTLDDDVRVRAGGAATTSTKNQAAASQADTKPGVRVVPDVSVSLDLGPDFQLRGRGLQARLAGKLVLTASGSAAPELTGSIRTVNGTYQAYGQRLQIERGLIRFYGPIDNPALAILAIRPKLSQRVGVQITGTALSPVVSLYSEPSLSDVETLTWLVLGRGSGAGGAEGALLQQAAMALLGGNGKSVSDSLSKAFGLDELSFRGGESATASSAASSASVTLGKRLSQDFYIAYESSLGGAMGVFYIFYDLSKRLTLRAQTGEQSAVDLIFTLRYD
jgi:translocation and assembly module TamB